MGSRKVVSRATARSGAQPYTTAVSAGRFELVCDEPEASGGSDQGPTPMELYLAGLVGCTSITLEMYAAKYGIALESVEVEGRVEKREDGSGYDVVRRIRVEGDLTDEERAHFQRVAEKTPVTRAVRDEVGVTTRWSFSSEATEDEEATT